MGVTNLYANLPGHLVEFKDGGLQLTSSTVDSASTRSLLILGTAFDGPINEPVKIDATTVSQVFGDEVDGNGYPNGATITKYAKQAFRNGFDDVRCMRVTGSQAYAIISGNQTTGYEDSSDTVEKNNAVEGNTEIQFNAADENPVDFFSAKTGDKIVITHKDESTTEYSLGASGADAPFTLRNWYGININSNVYLKTDKLKIMYHVTNFAKQSGTDAPVDLTVSAINAAMGANGATPDDTVYTTEKDITFKARNSANLDEGFYAEVEPADGYRFWNLKSNSAYVPNGDAKGILSFSDTNGDITAESGVSINYNTDANKVTIELSKDFVTSKGYADNSAEDPAPAEITLTDTFKVTYILYKESEDVTEKEFEVGYQVADTKFDISETVTAVIEDNEGENFTITSVSSGNVILTEDEYTIGNDNVINVNDTSRLSVGAKLTVAYTYKTPIRKTLELKVKSQWGGSQYKDATVKVEKVTEDNTEYTVITFTRASSKRGGSFSYTSKYYHTVDDLILAMNNDANNVNMFEIEIVKGEGTDLIDLLDATPDAVALSNDGSDGVNPTNNEMFKALSGDRYTASDVGTVVNVGNANYTITTDMIGLLKTQGAYQILENYNVDFIYPAGVYADSVQTVNPNSDFQRELALVCAVLTYRTKMTHGFIDVKPNSNTTLVGIDAYVSNLLNSHPNVYYMTDANGDVIYDTDGKPMDIGWYTSVVVGPEPVMRSDRLGTYYGSPAIAYAALNAVIAPESAPTNKAIRNVNGMKFKFSNKQMNAILGQRMVCFTLKNEGSATASSTPYVVDGVTAGAPNCDYSQIATVKILTDVVDQVREVCDPFIGEPNTLAQRNAMSAQISKRLGKLAEIGEIQSYEFEVSATIQQQLLGEAQIALTVVPASILRKITTVVALRAAQ